MKKLHHIDHKPYRVLPGKKVTLSQWKTRDAGPFEGKEQAGEALVSAVSDLAEAQELLYASDRYSLLLIFQAMDAAGKDGAIKHVMSGINPQGCQVHSFKAPSAEELDHDFLWRCSKALPERGRIGIFNRSYYEEVLVVKVHPELLDRQKLPPGRRDAPFWRTRYDAINCFERHLHNSGMRILKFFLHVSREEQRERFLERLQNPEKHWKFSSADLSERQYWKQYMAAYKDMLEATSTEAAPWYVIPADRKWFARALIASIIVAEIESLRLSFPKVPESHHAALEEARKQLLAED